MRSLCTALSSYSFLALLDFTTPFQISYTPDMAVGDVIKQEYTSVHEPIALLSKILISSEK